jgi:DNA-binding MarR family transcriptional regulator
MAKTKSAAEATADKFNTTLMDILLLADKPHRSDLSNSAFEVLKAAANGGIDRVGAVAELLDCAPNSASEFLSRLIERGLLKKQRREDNARFVSFSLTPAGKKELKSYLSLEKKRLADAVEALSDEEQTQLLDLSTKLRDALKALGSAPAAK